jgi:lipoprotein-anchoring transpeptidase ErfK/SrfK
MFPRIAVVLLFLCLGAGHEAAAKRGRSPQGFATAEQINAAQPGQGRLSKAALVRLAVILDRAHFSPGVIDGLDGDNLRRALRAYRRSQGIEGSGRLDQASWQRLVDGDAAPAIVSYVITEEDAKGPFTPKIPAKLEAQASLDRLGYRDALELLAERFHMDEALLRELNRGAAFDRPGATIQVANVDRSDDPTRVGKERPRKAEPEKARSGDARVARIVADKADRSLSAFDQNGGLLAVYPASIGSPDKPAPSGTLQVVRIVANPSYTYNPKYEFKGVEATEKFSIRPGPNNPVGAVWIALNGEGYGIHGTPEPSKVGKTGSHGCVRLTNWDALELARMVGKGVPVEFDD